LGSILLAERLGIANRPKGATLPQLWGISLLCGIGFTMSLFIGSLAFHDQMATALAVDERVSILLGSAVSAVAGYLLLRYALGRDLRRG
jgi:NhaA family Na+:H+ antiporter